MQENVFKNAMPFFCATGINLNVGRIKKLILPMNTEALPHTPIGGQSTLPTPTVSQSAKIIDKNEDKKCFFPYAIRTLIYFLKLT